MVSYFPKYNKFRKDKLKTFEIKPFKDLYLHLENTIGNRMNELNDMITKV